MRIQRNKSAITKDFQMMDKRKPGAEEGQSNLCHASFKNLQAVGTDENKASQILNPLSVLGVILESNNEDFVLSCLCFQGVTISISVRIKLSLPFKTT